MSNPADDLVAALSADYLHHAMRQASGGKNPPDGGKLRKPDAKAKTWEVLGISRATWYRLGKPEDETALSVLWAYRTQADIARLWGFSIPRGPAACVRAPVRNP